MVPPQVELAPKWVLMLPQKEPALEYCRWRPTGSAGDPDLALAEAARPWYGQSVCGSMNQRSLNWRVCSKQGPGLLEFLDWGKGVHDLARSGLAASREEEVLSSRHC